MSSEEQVLELPATLRVADITVSRLFGTYDHSIRLSKNEGVAIAHGPNGVGKTVMLQLIHWALNGDLYSISTVPFERLRVRFSCGDSITFLRDPGMLFHDEDSSLIAVEYFRNSDPNATALSFPFDAGASDARLDRALERRAPYIVRMGPNEWIDERDGELLSRAMVVTRFFRRRNRLPGQEIPDWYTAVSAACKTHLIQAQRLVDVPSPTDPPYRHRANTVKKRIETCAEQIAGQISETFEKYTLESQRLDQTFPTRLLTSGPKSVTQKDLQGDLEKMDRKLRRLQRIGILDSESMPSVPKLSTISPAMLSVLALHVRDSLSKLAEFDALAERADELLQVINSLFDPKHLHIDAERGLVATAASGREFPLRMLSSGEQHEVVLHYELLFNMKPGALLLLDEPELSQHVSWQKTFLPTLLRVAAKRDFDAIIATHSPYIVGDRPDLLCGLGAPDDPE